MSRGAKDSEPFRRSPFYPVMLGAPQLDFRLARGGKHEYPILDDLAEQGSTHYVVYPLPGMDAQSNAEDVFIKKLNASARVTGWLP